MTKRTGITDNRSSDLSTAGSSDIDPRLVELVRFMARCAAENDFEILLEAAKQRDNTLPGKEEAT